MGHLGLTPQAVHRIGGYRVTAREEDEARTLAEQARALEDAGCFGIVLELVPAPLAARVSASLDIPTIGIGAGPDCDGQVLVLHDMLGLNQGFEPRFLRRFAELGAEALEAMKAYAEAVREGSYPAESESYEG
jgi:3-methyl-2-oxobutanoate hydroxymethyltransferase